MGAEHDLVDVLVETPQGSRKKYEYDKERKGMRLDRRLFSATAALEVIAEAVERKQADS